MKILHINAYETTYGWGADYFVSNSFRALGHEVTNLDYRKHRNNLSKEINSIKDIDTILLQRGDYFPIELLKSMNPPKYFWATELVSRRPDQNRLFKSDLFEKVFVRTNNCRLRITQKNWLNDEKINIMLSGFDEAIHHPIPGMKKDIDVLFMGSLTKRRKKILDRISKYLKVTIIRAFGSDMVKYLNRSKIVLNIHAEDFLDTETRVFEVLGSKAFLLSETLSIENPFTNGLHFIESDGGNDLIEKISFYLKNADERSRIAETGYHEARANHTWSARASQLVEIMSTSIPRYESPTFMNPTRMLSFQKYQKMIYYKLLMLKLYHRVLLKIDYQNTKCFLIFPWMERRKYQSKNLLQ